MDARISLWCGFWLYTISASAAARGDGWDTQRISLAVGEQRVLSAAGVHSYSEGAPGIVDVRLTPDGTHFIVVGARPGRTTLLLLLEGGEGRTYDISVSDERLPDIANGDDPIGSVEARDNVRLDFYFVQLSGDYHHQLGIAWPASLGGGAASASANLMTGRLTNASAVVSDQALPQLDLAQSKGWAKVIREAAVVTQNGSAATFGGGGEVNIPVQSALSVGVRQIVFGSTIEVRPRYDRGSGRIELAVHADISDLTTDGGSGIPGRTTSVLDSVVNLELGQSVVLAGLSSSFERSSDRGLPELSRVPILGALFGTHARARSHSQSVVLIVPSVVDAVSTDARERVERAFSAYRSYEGDPDPGHLQRALGAAPPASSERSDVEVSR